MAEERLMLNTDKARTFQNLVEHELARRGYEADSVMAEYITIMVVNQKTQDQINAELSDLIGPDYDTDFAKWIFAVAKPAVIAPSDPNALSQAQPGLTTSPSNPPVSIDSAASPTPVAPTGPRPPRLVQQALGAVKDAASASAAGTKRSSSPGTQGQGPSKTRKIDGVAAPSAPRAMREDSLGANGSGPGRSLMDRVTPRSTPQRIETYDSRDHPEGYREREGGRDRDKFEARERRFGAVGHDGPGGGHRPNRQGGHHNHNPNGPNNVNLPPGMPLPPLPMNGAVFPGAMGLDPQTNAAFMNMDPQTQAMMMGMSMTPLALQEMLGSNMAMMQQMASMMTMMQQQQQQGFPTHQLHHQGGRHQGNGFSGNQGQRPNGHGPLSQQGSQGSQLKPTSPPFVPSSSISTTSTSAAPTAPTGPPISAPDRPTSTQICKFGTKCLDIRCSHSHPSPVATPESGIVLKTEVCEKGPGGIECDDMDCEKSHVSPSVKAHLGRIKWYSPAGGEGAKEDEAAATASAAAGTSNAPAASSEGAPSTSAAAASTPPATTAPTSTPSLAATSLSAAPTAAQIPCKFGLHCTRPNCHFSHPPGHRAGYSSYHPHSSYSSPYGAQSSIPCKFGAKCTRADCTFQHPPGRTLPGQFHKGLNTNTKASDAFQPAPNRTMVFNVPKKAGTPGAGAEKKEEGGEVKEEGAEKVEATATAA